MQTSIRETLEILKITGRTSVLLRAPHGVGKSAVVKQLAETEGKRLIDFRLGQTTEGELLGLMQVNPATSSTTQVLPEWYMQAHREPCVLFFDEINRGMPSVMQGAFQIVLDRELAGVPLHKDTRVIAAINTGAEYDVSEMDPALLDRFCVIDFAPTIEEFVSYAAKTFSDPVASFVQLNPGFVEHHSTAKLPSGTITPSRRAWELFDRAFALRSESTPIRKLAASFVGEEAASAFVAHMAERKTVTVQDVLKVYKNKTALAKLLQQAETADQVRLTDQVFSECKGPEGEQYIPVLVEMVNAREVGSPARKKYDIEDASEPDPGHWVLADSIVASCFYNKEGGSATRHITEAILGRLKFVL